MLGNVRSRGSIKIWTGQDFTDRRTNRCSKVLRKWFLYTPQTLFSGGIHITISLCGQHLFVLYFGKCIRFYLSMLARRSASDKYFACCLQSTSFSRFFLSYFFFAFHLFVFFMFVFTKSFDLILMNGKNVDSS